MPTTVQHESRRHEPPSKWPMCICDYGRRYDAWQSPYARYVRSPPLIAFRRGREAYSQGRCDHWPPSGSYKDVSRLISDNRHSPSTVLNDTLPSRQPSTPLKVNTYSPSRTSPLLSSPGRASTIRPCSNSHRRTTPGKQPVAADGVIQHGGSRRMNAMLRMEVSVTSPCSLYSTTS